MQAEAPPKAVRIAVKILNTLAAGNVLLSSRVAALQSHLPTAY